MKPNGTAPDKLDRADDHTAYSKRQEPVERRQSIDLQQVTEWGEKKTGSGEGRGPGQQEDQGPVCRPDIETAGRPAVDHDEGQDRRYQRKEHDAAHPAFLDAGLRQAETQ